MRPNRHSEVVRSASLDKKFGVLVMEFWVWDIESEGRAQESVILNVLK